MARFASGRFAWALCQRCGLRHKLLNTVIEVDTGLRVGLDCADEPDPYRRLKSRIDAQGLYKPSPDVDIALDPDPRFDSTYITFDMTEYTFDQTVVP